MLLVKLTSDHRPFIFSLHFSLSFPSVYSLIAFSTRLHILFPFFSLQLSSILSTPFPLLLLFSFSFLPLFPCVIHLSLHLAHSVALPFFAFPPCSPLRHLLAALTLDINKFSFRRGIRNFDPYSCFPFNA